MAAQLYPTKTEREHVALRVVKAYTFLKDAIGSGIVSKVTGGVD